MDDAALLGLGLQADCQAQQRSLHYFEQLKQSDTGWRLCIDALISNLYTNDHIRFFCLQVVEHYLKTRYATAAECDQQHVRSFLLSWFQILGRGSSNGNVGQTIACEQTFILNKVAQLFVQACLVDYPRRWLSFFDDLVSALVLGPAVVGLYLRILIALDSEVVDRDIAHSEQELQRNTQIKDAMRVQCICKLVDSWYQILTLYERSHSALVCSCLDVVGAYVSWIDVNLIANDRFVTLMLRFMSAPLLRESACDCVHEIICKGMDPSAKTTLIESFTAVLKTAGVLKINEGDDGDYLAKLSKLVNGMGLQLIQCWQKLAKSKDMANARVAMDALESKLPYLLQFLASNDDDVSGTIAPFAHDYVALLKQLSPLNAGQKSFVKDLLYVVIQKMKYEDLNSYDFEGEDEAMFQEYRKELRIIFNNLGSLDSEMLISVVHGIVTQTLTTWQSAEVTDVELAVTLLYQLGEALPSSQSQQFCSDPAKASVMQTMMKVLMTSGVSRCQHPAVQLQFFETVVRYDKFFSTDPQCLPDVLAAFLDDRGLWNKTSQVCSRTSYLFSRFVKNINKLQLQGYLEQILDRLQGLLVINSPFNGINHQCLSAEDQQFMYETAGILIVQSQFTPERKQELMRSLLAPIVGKFDELLQYMMAEADEERQQEYAACISQAMGFASRTSKGFSGQQTVKANGCVDVYIETLKVFLRALNVPVQRSVLHQGVRQFLHRMVVCLEADILQFIPVAMESLLKQADVRELYDFIPFVNQVVQKFKKAIVPFLQQVFMPIVSTIFQALTSSVDERDQVSLSERRLLQRGYFTFISTLVNNNVTEVLSNQSSQNLQEVLATVIHGAVEIPDPVGQKTCFGILKKLVEVWGDHQTLPGFNDFIYKSIVPACFIAPMKPSFDLLDAQTVLALNESAACLKAIHEKRGDEFLMFIQVQYLPTLNVPQHTIQEFCRLLVSDSKAFQSYYKTFFIQGRS